MLSHLSLLHSLVLSWLERIGARTLAVPSELALMEATVKGEQAEMRSWAWEQDFFHYIRLSYFRSKQRVEMLNLTLYPRIEYEIPMFATDFVIVGDRLRIGLIDAMPLLDTAEYQAHWVTPFAPLYAKSKALAVQYERKLDWSFRYLSPHACMATQLELNQLPALFELWEAYFSLYWQLLNNTPQHTSADFQSLVQHWQQDYNTSHLAVEHDRNPLMHYFGTELGKRYHEEFLFRL